MSKKELVQLLRDRITVIYLLLAPVIEVVLFSLVFNSDPRHLPTAVLNFDPSPYTRTIIQGLQNTTYFDVTHVAKNEKEAEELLASNQVQFVIYVPEDFTRNLVKGTTPQIVIEADAVNPMATNNAFSTAKSLEATILQDDLRGPLVSIYPKSKSPPFEFVVDAKYNPERNPKFFSIPGLIGTILGGALLMMTLISLTKERDSGTLEGLFATQTRPLEVVLSKLFPSMIVGYIQFTSVIFIAYLYNLPFRGSILLIYFAAFFFLLASLLWGLFISGLSSSAFQAVQLGGLFWLPNMLFSGFIFPFRGMPTWAQWIGEVLPLTHFLRILTGIMLKGNGLQLVMRDIWPMALFIFVITVAIVMMFRQTLD